jgi:serine/threonine-protein kinase
METLGPYQILRELGRGGCGVVYLAEDPRIGRKVAIKTIHSGEGAKLSDALRERFRREARSAGVLSHPNIVTIHEFNDSGDVAYIVMEYVDGMSLAEKMARERLPLGLTLKVVQAGADALDFAHEQNIVHRDVKPANFLVSNSGFVKVADFGIAKLMDADTGGLTSTGMVVGTAYYMSPEQVAAAAVTGRSDQFSLAVIAYELLTGKRPFAGDSWASVLHQIMTLDPPPVKQYRESLGDNVTLVLRKGLAKDPADRYPSCRQFAMELHNAVIGTTLERTLPQPVAQAMKGPLPPPPTAQTTATMMYPQPAASVEAPAATQRSAGRSIVLAVLAGAVVIGGVMYRSATSKPAPNGGTPAETAIPSAPAPASEPEPQPAAPSPAKSKTPVPFRPEAPKTVARQPAPVVQEPPPVATGPLPSPTPLVVVQSAPAPPPPAPAPAPAPAPVQAAPPESRPAIDPRTAEANAWERARNSTDITVLERFRAGFPNGSFFAEAGRRIEQVEWDRASRANDAKAYGDFLAKYPAGAFSDRARAELAKIERTGLLAANRRLVDAALERYRQAFEAKNIEALKSVWPSLGRNDLASIQSFFRIARSIRVELRLTGEPEVTADAATVQARRILAATDERGAMPAQDQMVTIRLRKSGDAMLIDSIQASNK